MAHRKFLMGQEPFTCALADGHAGECVRDRPRALRRGDWIPDGFVRSIMFETRAGSENDCRVHLEVAFALMGITPDALRVLLDRQARIVGADGVD